MKLINTFGKYLHVNIDYIFHKINNNMSSVSKPFEAKLFHANFTTRVFI